jgi:hypothetical protein
MASAVAIEGTAHHRTAEAIRDVKCAQSLELADLVVGIFAGSFFDLARDSNTSWAGRLLVVLSRT